MSCPEHCSVFPRARANAGDAWRLEATLRCLESGRCIQVAVIGEAPQQLPCITGGALGGATVGLEGLEAAALLGGAARGAALLGRDGAFAESSGRRGSARISLLLSGQ